MFGSCSIRISLICAREFAGHEPRDPPVLLSEHFAACAVSSRESDRRPHRCGLDKATDWMGTTDYGGMFGWTGPGYTFMNGVMIWETPMSVKQIRGGIFPM